MNRSVMMALAATALLPAAAAAQPRTAEPPVKWEDVPDARIKVPGHPPVVRRAPPPAPGVSWQAPPAPPVQTRVLPAPHAAHPPRHVEVKPHHPAPHHKPPMAHGQRHVDVRHAPPPPVVQHHGRGHAGTDKTRRVIIHRRGDGAAARHHRGINAYPHYRRVERGYALPHQWWGSRYHIQNWSSYGLPQPLQGCRWVRYYDDALMVDSYGRVHDGRWGMAWDEWQDRWSYDERGVPAYVGNGDFYPGDEDYAWVEGQGGGYAEGYEEGYSGGGMHHQGYAVPMPYPMPGYGAGYGYGAAYGYGAVVTETTVVTSPTVIAETVYEDVVVEETRVHQPRRAKARRKAPCNCPKPKPRPYGERG